MGKLILCSGRLAKNPLHFELTNTNIYSIEELCYYIYNNIYAIAEDTFDAALIHWLQEEAGLSELALKIEKLIAGQHTLKDIIVTLLCGSDYYMEQEIKSLIVIIDEICNLPSIKKQKIRGDIYVKYGKYQKAARVYSTIVKDKEAEVFTKEEYGNIIHNMGVIKIHTASSLEAAEEFQEAYKHNGNEDSLKSYLFALKLSNCQKEFEEAIMKYNVSPEFILEINQEMEEKYKEAETSMEYVKLMNMEKLKKDGKVNEYYKELNVFIEQWKQDYRKKILQ